MTNPSNTESASIDFYFDVVCPYAYLAFTQVGPLAERLGVTLNYRPVLLGGLFRVIGAGDGPMPSMPPAKARLNLLDMHRWAEHHEVPLNMPASHPSRSVLAMRTVLASADDDAAHVPRAAAALYRAYWEQAKDISDEKVVRAALDDAGLDGNALVQAAQAPAIKQRLRDAVDEAAAQGAFGVPTFVVNTGAGRELFWGQDRLSFVEQMIAVSRA